MRLNHRCADSFPTTSRHACGRESLVGLVAVGENRRVGSGVSHERMEGLVAVAADRLKPDAARPAFVAPFHRADDVELTDGAAALSAPGRLVLCPKGDARLVDLDDFVVAAQLLAIRIDHRAAQFVQEEPRRLVGADAELGLELKGQDAVRVRRH